MLNKTYNIEALKNNIVLIDDIIKKYVDYRMSIDQIGATHGLSFTTVRKILLENGVVMRQKNNR